MPSLSETVRLSGGKRTKQPSVEAPAPPPVKRQRRLIRITVLLYPEEIAELDMLWEQHGFHSRHHLLQWLILYGIKAMKSGALKPERRLSRVVEVQKP